MADEGSIMGKGNEVMADDPPADAALLMFMIVGDIEEDREGGLGAGIEGGIEEGIEEGMEEGIEGGRPGVEGPSGLGLHRRVGEGGQGVDPFSVKQLVGVPPLRTLSTADSHRCHCPDHRRPADP